VAFSQKICEIGAPGDNGCFTGSIDLAYRFQANGAAFYLLPPRAWELGLGGLVALWGLDGRRGRVASEILTVAGAAAILAACALFSDSTPFPGWLAAIPALGTAALLAGGAVPGTTMNRILRASALVFIGRLSIRSTSGSSPSLSR
jgi:peptidoglycan/LPS O-acetylase OafA/YrhL